MEKEKCVGDILLNMIDKSGNRIGSESFQKQNDDLVYSIGLDNLKNIVNRGSVWVLAGQPTKANVIHAALKSGYANGLIIESATAKRLLSLSQED